MINIDKQDYSEGKFYSWVDFSSGSSTEWLQVHRVHGPNLVDAVVTLALAQNAPLPPYYNFKITAGNDYIARVLEKAKVKAGAVVYLTAPDSPLTDEDIIIRAVFDGKYAYAKGSLAEMLQIKEKDVLLAINGIDVTSPTQLIELAGKGSVMTVKVRGGAVMSLQSALSI